MEFKKIESIAGNIVTPVDFKTVEVDFGKGIVEDFSDTYVGAMNAKLALRGSSKQFDETEMRKYLNFLLVTRINSVNNTGKFDHRTRQLKVPALYALTLTHIGSVYDKDLGIELTPKIDTKSKDISNAIMTADEAIKFSRGELSIVEDLGFELVEGLPNDKNGDGNFMYFHMAEEAVTRHDNQAHPGYAVLAAFFRMKQLQDVLSQRVSYGLISEYDEMLKGLIYDEAK